MSDAPAKIRFLSTWPPAAKAPDTDALIAAHWKAVGAGRYPEPKTPEEQSHADQTRAVKVGWDGGNVYEYTCPACGIRWRNG